MSVVPLLLYVPHLSLCCIRNAVFRDFGISCVSSLEVWTQPPPPLPFGLAIFSITFGPKTRSFYTVSFYYWLMYNRLSLSRPRLSRITAYFEVKIWSLFKHEYLATGNKKYFGKEEKLLLRSNFSSFPHIFSISQTSGVKLHIIFEMWQFNLFFFSILQICYVGVRISQSSSKSPLDF